jgi:hypothetical protein
MHQTIGVVRVRLIRRHIERRFNMARIDADRRQPFGARRMIEPYRQRSGLEYHTFHGWRPFADPKAFRSGRDLSAWVGLVPKQNLSAARTGLAVSANKAIAICAACSPLAHSP